MSTDRTGSARPSSAHRTRSARCARALLRRRGGRDARPEIEAAQERALGERGRAPHRWGASGAKGLCGSGDERQRQWASAGLRTGRARRSPWRPAATRHDQPTRMMTDQAAGAGPRFRRGQHEPVREPIAQVLVEQPVLPGIALESLRKIGRATHGLPARDARGPASGIWLMTASVVSSRLAIDAAFWSAERTTLVGSITPASTRSSYCSLWALNP